MTLIFLQELYLLEPMINKIYVTSLVCYNSCSASCVLRLSYCVRNKSTYCYVFFAILVGVGSLTQTYFILSCEFTHPSAPFHVICASQPRSDTGKGGKQEIYYPDSGQTLEYVA